ncbi:MAG: hypothetical protein CM15mP83_1130 [Flavobacteriaceae bacterium]|nr:MAG: hypothetical protein CM15mP83_1130 [Flavobacteriaceae bacterium]
MGYPGVSPEDEKPLESYILKQTRPKKLGYHVIESEASISAEKN